MPQISTKIYIYQRKISKNRKKLTKINQILLSPKNVKINRFLIFARNPSLEHCYVFGSILFIFDVNTSIFNQFLRFAEFLLGVCPIFVHFSRILSFLSKFYGAWLNFGIFLMSSFRLCPFLLVLAEFCFFLVDICFCFC